jgi:hypothetical protein
MAERPAAELAKHVLAAPIRTGGRWQGERTNSWHDAFNRLPRCYERR